MDEYKKLLNNRKRINPIDGKKYDIDELYNKVLEDQTYQVSTLLDGTNRRKHLKFNENMVI